MVDRSAAALLLALTLLLLLLALTLLLLLPALTLLLLLPAMTRPPRVVLDSWRAAAAGGMRGGPSE